jgi:hypothetical protein
MNARAFSPLTKGTFMTVAAVPPARIVPTTSQPVRIPWGDWAEQILVHEKSLIEAGIQAGIEFGAGASPIGGLVVGLVGPTVVKQLVDQGLTLAEGMFAGQAITISQPNWLESYVITTINQVAPNLAAKIGDDLTPMVQAAIAKVPAPPAAAAAPRWSGAPNAI